MILFVKFAPFHARMAVGLLGIEGKMITRERRRVSRRTSSKWNCILSGLDDSGNDRILMPCLLTGHTGLLVVLLLQ